MSGWLSCEPTVMMSAALAPRPWTRIIAARAFCRGAPERSTFAPSCGPAIAYSFPDAGVSVLEPSRDLLGPGLARPVAPSRRASRHATGAPHDHAIAAGKEAAGRAHSHDDRWAARADRRRQRGRHEGARSQG